MCPIEPPSIAADSPFSITALSRNHSNIFIISPVYSSSWCPHKLLHWKMPLSKWWLGIWEMKNNIQQCIPWYVLSLGNKQTFHLGGKNIIDDICGWLSPMYPHHVEKLTWWFNIHMKNQHVPTHHMSSGLKIEGFEAWNSEKVLVQSSIFNLHPPRFFPRKIQHFEWFSIRGFYWGPHRPTISPWVHDWVSPARWPKTLPVWQGMTRMAWNAMPRCRGTGGKERATDRCCEWWHLNGEWWYSGVINWYSFIGHNTIANMRGFH